MKGHGALIVGGVLALAAGLPAQQPVLSGTRADSLTELARLDAAVNTGRDDAAAWHARGFLAWQLSQGNRAVGTSVNREQLRLNQVADSSLLRAITLAPTNVRYLKDFATYRSQGSAIVRGGATRYLKRAFDAAKAGTDSLALAELADALGKVEFKNYQMFYGRRMFLSNGPGAGINEILNQQAGPDARSVSYSEQLIRQTIESRSTPIGGNPPPGVQAFDDALDYFETATRAAPSLPLPWRHRFAALADRRRWEELERAANDRLKLAPWDPDAWLALGLAQHRQSNPAATAAFDSAFAQMTDSTRKRLDRVERIMRPKAVRSLDTLSPADRERTARFVWTSADPLWSVPGNEARAEFLARVAFAELRFTDEEKGLHGVDTYPGDLHVRFGFPKISEVWECGEGIANDVCWFWWFAPRVQFIVRYVAAFNTGRAFQDDINTNEDITLQAPAAFTNIPGVPAIDSLPLRVARFRSDGANPSVFVSATVPVKHLAEGGVPVTAPLTSLWLIADGAVAVARDSVRANALGVAGFKVRAPEGDVYARAETVIPGAAIAARGTALSPALPASDDRLALSDIIVASSAEEGDRPAARWFDLRIDPAPDSIPVARSIAVAWEIYGLKERAGAQNYGVRLTLRKKGGFAGRIVAQIAGLVGQQRGGDQVTLGFDRTAPARAVTVDHVALSLREAPAGDYTLTLEITDRAGGTMIRRATTLTLVP